jgi:hypothetical protein
MGACVALLSSSLAHAPEPVLAGGRPCTSGVDAWAHHGIGGGLSRQDPVDPAAAGPSGGTACRIWQRRRGISFFGAHRAR